MPSPTSVLAELAGNAAIAQRLLDRFGTLDATLAAPAADLKACGVRERGVRFITLAHEARTTAAAEKIRDRCLLSSWSALQAYLKTTLANEPREQARVLYLDRKNRLIADELAGQGTVDHAPIYPREVLRRALELHASALILVHNHPSGDPEPSRQDISLTDQIVARAQPPGIVVHDHLIVGNPEILRMRSRGLV